MFANCSLAGTNNSMPDVCLTPVPSPAGPIPTPMPYPNIAMLPMALPPTTALKVLIMAMPAHNLATTIPMSNGDQAGCMPGGVMSGIIMGPSRHMKGSMKVLYGSMPCTRSFMDMTMQNLSNCPGTGMTIVPSQTKIMVMS
jgi:hypothetical protein